MIKKSASDTILDTSEALFNAYGFHAVGVDRIREVSGVSKVTMYKYFNSKRDLVVAVLKRRDARFITSLIDRVEAGITIHDKINNLIEWHINWFNQSTFYGCMFVSANKELGISDSEIKEISKTHKQRVFDIIMNIFDNDNSNRFSLASALFLYIEGATAEAALNGDSPRIEKSRDIIVKWIVNNI